MEIREDELKELKELKNKLEYYENICNLIDKKIKENINEQELENLTNERKEKYRELLNIEKKLSLLKLGKKIK